ncbi:hypothetical protein NUU61_005641 [Penicillium alfredii]|uniref:Uncharacterized protein n=1 Tax=Penicillium alfredii TaxID=1506179 RepID=A0A9W9K813_9EURO|nr:uncharacterized protein NUU61_005641 [Penicillium alfredii]KAJ5096285.1 hypothetical protein NUU61_005641 [Penicillium alfredii]
MSPAPLTDMQPDLHQDQLQAVGKAFDALLLTVYRLTSRNHELTEHMDEVYREYADVIGSLPPPDRSRALHTRTKLLNQQKELQQGLVHSKPRVEEQSLNSMDVMKTLASHHNVDESTTMAIVDGVKGFKALLRSQNGPLQVSSASCILARGPDPSVSLEQDFTTNGTQGSLHCPFSKPNQTSEGPAVNGNGDAPKIQIDDTCGHENLDPIKAEQDERHSSHTPSARSSNGRCPVSRCPIRFLDKHSPEEIAEYVERHKHEIPRSHAICVKRYQRDPQNMRQLDVKYGGLINMISGLGVKHQAFLPNRQANGGGDEQTSHSASSERVEKWAEDVDLTTPGPQNDDDKRQSHFDRPLREVRVGESPSRPWGIPVPVAHQPSIPAPFSGSASVPISPDTQPPISPDPSPPVAPEPKPAGRCPFGHDAPQPNPDAAKIDPPWANWGAGQADPGDQGDAGAKSKSEGPTTTKPDLPSTPAHVTFNGPVFFGYSAEQTASLMQQLGGLGQP